jgi:hypothetical protein
MHMHACSASLIYSGFYFGAKGWVWSLLQESYPEKGVSLWLVVFCCCRFLRTKR